MRLCACLLISLFLVVTVAGQQTEYFVFSAPRRVNGYVSFDKVEFADNRLVREYVGITSRGPDKLAPVWLHRGLSEEIGSLIDTAVKDVPGQNQVILLNLRNFFINQARGSFDFHIECYAKWDEQYWLVYQLDSSYKVTAPDRKGKLNQKVNEVMSSFILRVAHLDLSKQNRITPVTSDYISNIDLNEKKAIPVFNVRLPPAGVYYTYEEFKNNKPRLTEFDFKKRQKALVAVYRLPAEKIPRDSVYAVCDGKDVWLATPHEYAKLNKRGLDFYFEAIAFESNKVEEMSLAFLFFGIQGALVSAVPHTVVYEYRLNHLNGKYILLRKAPER